MIDGARTGLLHYFFAMFSPVTQRPRERNLSEDEAYLAEPIASQLPETFWSTQISDNFPTLRRLATKYLSIPATSASVERLFNFAVAVIRARRNRLCESTVESLLMLMQQ